MRVTRQSKQDEISLLPARSSLAQRLHGADGLAGDWSKEVAPYMIRSSASARVVHRMHVPLRRLALCLDCDEASEIGDACPACGSETWLPLARFLERRGVARVPGRTKPAAREVTRHLLVVARTRMDLFEPLRRAFAGHDSVRVILDRRTGDRRRQSDAALMERRRRDRRRRPDLEEKLRTHGCVLIPFSMELARRFATR
jgi:hypothetical protein